MKIRFRHMLIMGLISLVIPVRGAYLESDGSESLRERPPTVRPMPRIPRRHAFRDLLRSVQPGSPSHYRNLSLFPLLLHRRGGQGIKTLDEALERGWITIREHHAAQVGKLLVRNDSRHKVLLMAGEIVTGGKQNRIIRQDVLLGTNTPDWVSVPVYCGEKGRWDAPHTAFKSAGSLAGRRLRESAAQSKSQDSVWGSIDQRMAEAEVESPTRDYQQIYEDDTTSSELEACITHFQHLCGQRTVGVIAVLNGRIIGCDLFSDPELLSRLWGKICRSYAIETLGTYPDHRHRHHSVTLRQIRQFLDRAATSRLRPMRTPGIGAAAKISGMAQGHTLSWNGTLVHATFFPSPTPRHPIPKLPKPAVPEPYIQGGHEDHIWQSE